MKYYKKAPKKNCNIIYLYYLGIQDNSMVILLIII